MTSKGITQTVSGDPLPNIPWEDRPAGSRKAMWRFSRNPVITRDDALNAGQIHNSSAIPFNNKFTGIFRVDDNRRVLEIRRGESEDGIKWKVDDATIDFVPESPEVDNTNTENYDPRITRIDDTYYITWCWHHHKHGPMVGLAHTKDFKTFHQMPSPLLPRNRNAVLFSRKIRGKYAMLTRPCGTTPTTHGDIFYSDSSDLAYWGNHHFVLGKIGNGWQRSKIGAGPPPIETSEGWLLLYHGVFGSSASLVYSIGGALLDLDEPWKVLYRTDPYIMQPEALYELTGTVPNVIFPCAALCDPPTGRIAIYYGAADTTVCLAFTYVDELIDFIKSNSV